MNLTAAQKREVERLTRAGYRIVRQMDSRDADWKGQNPDVLLIEETTASHRIHVEVDYLGRTR